MNGHTTSAPRNSRNAASARDKTGARPSDLQTLARRGWQELGIFLLISTAFFCIRQADLLAPFTEGARLLLGSPPPPHLITLTLIGYTLSAAVLILGRAGSGGRPVQKWRHLFLLTVFYLFYGFSGTLAGNFMGVFVAGLFLNGLEQLNVWTYFLKTHPQGTEVGGRS